MKAFQYITLIVALTTTKTWPAAASSTTSGVSTSGMILRFRTTTGSVVQLQVPDETEGKAPLRQLIQSVLNSSDENVNDSSSVECAVGSTKLDTTQTIAELGLKHGTLLTILNPSKDQAAPKLARSSSTPAASASAPREDFDPFPHLAKPRYTYASRAVRAQANRKGGMSYTDMDRVTSAIHKVETQATPVIQRIYMCAKSAEAFSSGCLSKSTKNGSDAARKVQHKCALLFGTVSKERMDQGMGRKARTSLSSTTADAVMCEVGKVHALWEPPKQSPTMHLYDPSGLVDMEQSDELRRALGLAKRLQLQPVGWIYTYETKTKNDVREEAQVPVLAREVITAGKIQTALMKVLGREAGGRFVTLALNAATGATEAFQMSDQSIQMVAEGVLVEPLVVNKGRANGDDVELLESRYIKTSAPVMVDGKETHEVDCVLCLVNTALLSHTGSLCGNGTVKSTGNLTVKLKTKLLTSLTTHGGGEETIKLLCDFNLLLGLSKVLSEKDMDELCEVVSKFSRGRRKGCELSKHLQLTLESIVGV